MNGIGGAGGFGGGVGSSGTQGGGGGSGYGGAIFVGYDATTSTGGSLTITGNALFRNNTVQAGSSNNGGTAGQAAGADIFIMRGANVTLAPGAGNTIRIEDGIADDSTASINSASWASGNGANVTIAGGGLIQFAAQNTYTGKTIITGATLETQLDIGINKDSSILFAGQGAIGSLQPHSNAGVLLLTGAVTRLAGTSVPGQIAWNGAGGFAADSTDGLVVNFGRTSNSASSGQTLLWGSNYLTTNSTLVFGSEYGLGSVSWMNAINLQGNTGNVVVYDSQQVVDGQTVGDAAYMRGNITNGALNVGSAGYSGTLYLTGQNALTGIAVNAGIVSTSDGAITGRLFNSNGGYATVHSGGELQLQGSENVTTVNVDNGGILLTKAGTTLTSTSGINNSGTMVLAGNLSTTTVTNNVSGNFTNTGTINATGVVNNAGTWSQGFLTNSASDLQVTDNANISAASVVNTGSWGVVGTQKIATQSLTGNGTFQITNETGGTSSTSELTVALSGDSTYAGTFTGDGSLNKTGTGVLTLTGANTNTGGTTVSAGTIDTAGGGTLADTGALTILSGATFKANTVDTVGAVSNAGTYDVNTNQTVATLQNNVGGVTNLQADLSAAGTVTNNGTVNVTGEHRINAVGFAGSNIGVVNLDSASDVLTINQSGNSTYAGTFTGDGSLNKTGTGVLTLTGANTNTGGTTVSAGTIDTAGGGTLADTGALTILSGATFKANTVDTVGAVSNAGTYDVNTNQTVATLQNNVGGVTNLQADLSAAGTVTNNGTVNVTGEHRINAVGFAGSNIGVVNLDSASDVLTINQSGNSTYAGTFTGDGSLNKTGTGVLTLTGANTNTGGTTVSAGTIDTAGGGTLADTGALTILSGATFKANTVDTVGAVSNAGTYDVNTNQTVATLQNNVGGVTNLQADLSAAGTVTNNGTVNVTGEQQLSTTGLGGSSTNAHITAGTSGSTTSLTLVQSGNSTYAGQIDGAGSFIKEGEGTLTLSGNAGAVNLGNKLVINAGIVSLATANILANTMDVQVNSSTVGNITTTGTLQLLNGDQSIAALGGAGAIDLENGNRLIVQNGGEFTGTVTGSGTLDIRSGSFTVNNHLDSTDPNSILSIGNNAGNIGATATVNSGDTLNYPNINLQNHGGLVVNGTVNATNTNLSANSLLEVQSRGTMTTNGLTLTNNSTADVLGKLNATTITVNGSSSGSATLHLGNGQALNNGGTAGVVIADSTTITNGTLSGNGSLSGRVLFASGSVLSPGNSPGLLTLSGDVTLGSGSVSLMQVEGVAGSRVAGTDYDQVQVGGKLAIQSGATLAITKLSGDELAQDEKLHIFSFGDGKVSGQFSSVTSGLTNEVIYNIATGTAIGMGANGYSSFLQRVAKTDNESAILSALNVNSTGGVKQFYGGYLLDRLADADSNGNTNDVFARFSPEAYAVLSDQVRGAMFDSAPSLLDDISKGSLGGSAAAYYDTQSTSLGQQYAKYSLSTQGIRLGYSREFSSGTVGSISASVGDYSTSSNYLSGKANGVAVTLAMAHHLPSVFDGLYLFGRTGVVYQNNDMTRTTNLGVAKADGVASQGAFAGIGMGYLTEFSGIRVRSSLEATSYRTSVDGFNESNAQSVTDALHINSQTQRGNGLIFDLAGSGKLSDRFDYDAGVRWTSFEQSNHTISATVNTEVTPFSVSTPGVKQHQLSVNSGLSYRLDKGENVRLDLRSALSNGTAVNLIYQNRF